MKMLNLNRILYKKEYEYLEERIENFYSKEDITYIKNFYQEIILSMYALFEGTITRFITGYLNELTEICKEYSKLPNKIKENHEKLSYELMYSYKKTKYKEIVTPKNILLNLKECFDNKPNFKLNTEAFLTNSNYKMKVLEEQLGKIDIKIKFDKSLIKNMKRYKDIYTHIETNNDISLKIIKEISKNIDKLLKERNYCAHNIGVFEIYGKNTLIEFLESINFVIDSLFKILEEELRKNSNKKL